MKSLPKSKRILPLSGALALAGIAAAAFTPVVHAADIFWQGGTASYTNAANWSGGVVPGPGDAPINANGLANVVQINAEDPDWTVGDLHAGATENGGGAFEQNGATVTVNGWFHIADAVNAIGIYTLNDGTLNVPNRLFMCEAPGTTATFNLNGGVINKSGGEYFTIADGGWNGDGERTATLNQTGGMINSSSEFHVGNISLGIGIYNLSGGTNNVSNWFAVGRFGGTGAVNMSGGRINKTGGGNFYFGENAGTAEFNFTGGVVDINSEFWLGNGGPSVAVMNMDGAASLTVGNWIAIGRNGGAGTLNLTNGTITKIGGGNLAIGAGGGAGGGIINQYGGAIINVANPDSITYLSENGGFGQWYLNGGAANLGLLQFCANGSGAGILYLNGGLLSVREINCGVAGANGQFYFNGGTLQANADNNNFFHDLGQVYVDAGGAIIDSQGFNVTAAQNLYDLGTGGGLTKLGSGTLKLTGYNNYSGPTTATAGKLYTTANNTGTSAYTVANGAGLGVAVIYNGAQVNVANVTLGTSGATTLDFDLGTSGNPSAAPLNVFDTLVVNGPVTVNIASDFTQVGNFPLLTYNSRTGAGDFVLGALPLGIEAHLETIGATLELVVTSAPAPRWDGSVAGGVWDIGTTANWVDLGTLAPTTYQNGNVVLFDDNASGTTTVNLTAAVTPGSVTVNNSALDYTFIGSGQINGNIGLTKQGTGGLNLLNTGGNNYTGPTIVSGGTLNVTNLANGGSPSAIGAASAAATNLMINNATFHYGGAPVTINRGYQAANATLEVDQALTLTSPAQTTDGTLQKTGPGTLTYAGVGQNVLSPANVSGSFQVNNGKVVLSGGSGAQTNRVAGDLWVGGTTNAGGTLVLSNASVGVGSWLAIARGSGTSGFASALDLYDSYLSANNVSLGYDNGISGNNQSARLTLNGSSVLYNTGGTGFNLSESPGSASSVTVSDNSWLYSANRLLISQAVGATGELIVQGNGAVTNGGYTSVGLFGTATVTLKDNAIWRALGNDFNVTDLAGAVGVPNIGTINISNNASLIIGTLYLSKNAYCTATINQSGGSVVNSGGGDWRIGGNTSGAAEQLGVWNLSGGSITCANNFQVGAYGGGYLNQSGGLVTITGGFPDIGRFPGGTGYLNVSGGVFDVPAANSRVLIGEQGTGTVNVSGTGVLRFGATGGPDGDTGLLLGVQGTGIGILNVTNGSVIVTNGTALGRDAGAQGTINLYGGVFATKRIYRNNSGAVGNINFDGGTLVAQPGAVNNFLSGLSAATVLSGGGTIDSGTNNINIDQALLDGGGNGGLTKTGTGTLNLNGANTYTGATAVNAGALGGTGTIVGPVTVASGATLAPGAGLGTLTINNSLTLAAGSSTSVEITMDGGAASDLVTGLTSVSYNGALVVNNIGAASLVPGTVFKLFNAASASGNFTSVTVLPAGAGTFNPATGELTIGAGVPPVVNPPVYADGNLVLTGTGGTPGGSYTWLTSTNVAAPLVDWTTNSTGIFTGTGLFSNAIPVNPAEAARFFRLQTP